MQEAAFDPKDWKAIEKKVEYLKDWEDAKKQAEYLRQKKEKQKEERYLRSGFYDQKTANLTPEEQAIREENLKCREDMNEKGVRSLMAAVCTRAILDYKKPAACANAMGRSAMAVRTECRKFFETDIFKHTTGLHNPEKVVEMIKRIPAGYDRVLEGRS